LDSPERLSAPSGQLADRAAPESRSRGETSTKKPDLKQQLLFRIPQKLTDCSPVVRKSHASTENERAATGFVFAAYTFVPIIKHALPAIVSNSYTQRF
jgi:hypothetical protein